MLTKHPHLVHWRDVYSVEKDRVGKRIPTFGTWLKEAMLASEATWETWKMMEGF